MKTRLLYLATWMLACTVSAMAEAPTGYYNSLVGKSESDLKTAVYQIINPHTQVSSYNNLPSYFRQTDVRPGTSYWWDMYSDMSVNINGTFGTYMNREHSLPKSWWGGSTTTPAYVDLYHLYPAEAKANQAKSNYPLGEIKAGTTPTFNNGVSMVGTGVNAGGATYVYEPANEYKGDFARTYFYMVTCYQYMNWVKDWQVKNGIYPSLQQWSIDLLLKWHRADPVSEKEINRNEAVYKIQNNRNPFIDDPDLAEYIWGNKKGQAYKLPTTVEPGGDATLFTPVNKMTIDFGEVALGNSITSQLIFRGENVYGTFSLGISGANKSLFKLSSTTVVGSLANSTSGTYVTITYTPNALTAEGATHQAQVNIEDGCLGASSYRVYLLGQCLPKPTLTQLTAVNPTSVGTDSYIARWDTQPADEVVDYYVVTVKRYKGSTVTTTEYPAETDSLQIDGLSEGDYDTYAVQSVRLEERSPMSNFITVTPVAAIEDIIADQPFVVETCDGFIRFRCSNTQTGVRIYDLAGRTIAIIPEVTDYMEYPLPLGAYFIVSDDHRHPIKIIAR
ncbi:MAG: endonuclease [Bacteroides sp.]|nr:endonuclease [Bacteroides sp.]MCM1413784.1 endonuclease [Bacteroides sp.]MCM1472197.1 endonuclease [Bacteroides sp.]